MIIGPVHVLFGRFPHLYDALPLFDNRRWLLLVRCARHIKVTTTLTPALAEIIRFVVVVVVVVVTTATAPFSREVPDSSTLPTKCCADATHRESQQSQESGENEENSDFTTANITTTITTILGVHVLVWRLDLCRRRRQVGRCPTKLKPHIFRIS